MIVIVDTGGANHASIQNAIKRLGLASDVSLDARAIRAASHVVLPGVGHAGFAMRRLRDAGLVEALVGLAQPVLGICLGMQILFQRSEEGDAECLGVLPGVVGALRPGPEWRVPNMGWSQLAPARESARAAGAFAGSDGEMRGSDGEAGAGEALLRGIHADAYFYFVHSFAAPLGPWAAATSRDPRRIPAVVARRNFVGTQFHPERSGRPGARLLANFLGASQ